MLHQKKNTETMAEAITNLTLLLLQQETESCSPTQNDIGTIQFNTLQRISTILNSL